MDVAISFNSPVLSLRGTPHLGHDEITNVLVDLGVRFRHTAESYCGSEPIHSACYGITPLLISASHATPHLRQGITKGAERMTGALAIALAKSLDASVILPIAPQSDDPNFDTCDDAPYKQELANIVGNYRLFLDIHGMKDHWGPDICIGIGDSLRGHSQELLVRNLEHYSGREGLTTAINSPFDSRHQGTVSSFARKNGCDAIQLELSVRCRAPLSVSRTFFSVWHGIMQWLSQG